MSRRPPKLQRRPNREWRKSSVGGFASPACRCLRWRWYRCCRHWLIFPSPPRTIESTRMACAAFAWGSCWPGDGRRLGAALAWRHRGDCGPGGRRLDGRTVCHRVRAPGRSFPDFLGAQPAVRPAGDLSLGLVKGAAIGLLAICAIAGRSSFISGPGPTPVPKEKARYVGVWDSGKGLQIELNKAGEAKVTQAGDSKVAACNTPVKPGETKVFNATFRGDDFLELASGALGETKVYRIQQRPRRRRQTDEDDPQCQ